jgi:diaminopimelate epimerase
MTDEPSTTIALTKHHGLGNDFLVTFDPIDADDAPAVARAVCDRRTGVGADGLLIGTDADGYVARMTLYNADGSRAEMSGNGIRCFAQAVARRRGTLDAQCILTDAGERLVTLCATDDPHSIDASVDMGEIGDLEEPAGWSRLGANFDRPVAHLSLGNPHAVVAVDNVRAVDLLTIGEQVPHINVEVVEPGPGPGEITMRVHERGAGITAACGTGAVAAATAARRWGLVDTIDGEIRVHMDGGSARVSVDQPAPGRATLTGPSTYIASIEVPLP